MPLWTDSGHGFQKVPGARADHPYPAFLCCPGPSLAHAPHLRGPGRIVCAVNTAYPRMLPDVWVGLDRQACFDAHLWHEPFLKVTRKWDDECAAIRTLPGVCFADLEDCSAAEILIRRDPESKFIWQKNTTIFAVHYLIWSGHKRIYFVGCDMGGARDYWDDRVLTGEQHANNRRLYASQVTTLRELQPLARRNGIEFISCTADSPLNEFMSYRSIREALAECTRALPAPRPLKHIFDACREADERNRAARSSPAPAAVPATAATGKAPVKTGKPKGRVSSSGVARRRSAASKSSIERDVVLVLRSGGDYQPPHVERLVKQLPGCRVMLLTDLTGATYPRGVKVVPLKHGWPGWWSKLELFSPELPGFRDRPFLFLDLDMTVRRLSDDFFTAPESVLLAPYTREEDETIGGLQSSIMFLHPRERAIVWERWRTDPRRFMRWYRGDQEFIASCGAHWETWQRLLPGRIASYKQNILRGKSYDDSPLRDDLIEVVAYHGKPRPWEVEQGTAELTST